MEEKILVEQHGWIKTITLNQPKKKNAISNSMAYTLKDMILACKDDDSRVIILTGAEKDFCAGADLDPNLLKGQGFDVQKFLQETYNPMVTAMREMDKVFIAKIRGNCVGAGFNFALACDLVYGSDTARFSQIFSRIGLSSDGGGAYFLPRKVGYHKAFELMATGRMIQAEEAKDLGIVNEILPDTELDEKVDQLANQLANGPFQAIVHAKQNVNMGMNGTLPEALELEAANQGKNFVSKDFFEGVFAFLQKRPAKFIGA